MIVSKQNAEHYIWGDVCDGWHLVKHNELSVIQERVPSGSKEVRHYHSKSRQFFFVLEGEATLEVNGTRHILHRHEGLEIAPGIPHQFINTSSSDVLFLVISQPASHGDRIAAE